MKYEDIDYQIAKIELDIDMMNANINRMIFETNTLVKAFRGEKLTDKERLWFQMWYEINIVSPLIISDLK